MDVTPRQQVRDAILAALADGQAWTLEQLAHAIGLHPVVARRYLAALVHAEAIRVRLTPGGWRYRARGATGRDSEGARPGT